MDYQYKGVPEYNDTSILFSKWFRILLENLAQMIVTPLAWMIGGLYVCSLFPYKNKIIILIFMIFFCAVLYIPFFYLKIAWMCRVFKYLFILCKGDRIAGYLESIEEKHWGQNRNIIFYYKYEYNEKKVSQKCRVSCLEINMNILNIDHKAGRFIIPEETPIPIAVYKNWSVVIHNDCGFYDIAHYKGTKWMGNFF